MKINNAYSSREEIIFGITQGAILGPLLSNIFIYDLFLIMINVNFTSHADENTPHVRGDSVIQVTESLEEVSDKLLCWFANNQMNANPDSVI